MSKAIGFLAAIPVAILALVALPFLAIAAMCSAKTDEEVMKRDHW